MMDYYDEEDNLDYDRFQKDWQAFRDEELAIKFAKAAEREYGITAEEWKNTPQKIKTVIVQMHENLDGFYQQFADLEEWRDSMPI